MINWVYYPKNQALDDVSAEVVSIFKCALKRIDSEVFQMRSDDVLAAVRPGLEASGFRVEKSKRQEDIVSVPVLYGINGKVEKSFEADAYKANCGYVVEVEAGRGVTNYQFLKDFFEACTMADVDKLCIAVRNKYRDSDDFNKVCKFFDALYASGRLGIPLDGLLIIGY